MALSVAHLAAAAVFLAAISSISPSQSATCTSQSFNNNKRFSFCNDLPQLDSFLHWTFTPAQSTLSIAFIAPPPTPGGWVSWAINPTSTGMVGSQALVASSDATGAVVVKAYNITSYDRLEQSGVWFQVKESSAEFSGGVITLFATLILPASGLKTVNHVWQVGPPGSNGMLGRHSFQAANLEAKGTLDLLNGSSTAGSGGGAASSKNRNRNIHGILNGVSWGIMFPVGILFARYLKVFPSANPVWFYLHISCQISAYIIGVAGFATGIRLGQKKSFHYYQHRDIGIALVVLSTLQVFALLLRPNKDHKYRVYWNVYHHSCGYAVLVLGIVNVFKGLAILQPGNVWKRAYIGVIAGIGGVALSLEIITWVIVLRWKRNAAQDIRI